MNKPKVIVYGAGGHAKVVIDIIEKQAAVLIECIVDDNAALHDCEVYGYRVISRDGLLARYGTNRLPCLVAIGSNRARQLVVQWLSAHAFTFAAPAIHPSAQVSRGVRIGEGTVLMANSVVNADTSIGQHAIVNTGATVDHDCQINEIVHIAPGAIICGGVSIGNASLIGAGAVVVPNLRVGNNATVGAGAIVVANVPNKVTVVGNPARILRSED